MIGLLASPLRSNPAQTTEELIANLRSPIVKTRVEAARKLGERRQREAAGPLAELIRKEASPEVKKEAVRSLGLIKVEDAIPAMLTALIDADKEVRQAAILGVVSLYIETNIDFITARRRGWNLFNPFLETYEATVVEPYTEVDARIIEGLVRVAKTDSDKDVRIAAVKALGVLRATSAIPQLGVLFAASDFLRVDILRTFIKLGDPSAGKYIIPFLGDDESDVRKQALTTIGILGVKEAVPKLIEVYNRPKDDETAKLALEALALIADPTAEEIFLQNLNHRLPDRRRFGNEGVARLAAKKHLERISRERIQEKDRSVQLAQAFALYKLGRAEFAEAVFQELESARKDQAYAYLLEIEPEDLFPFLHRGGLEARKRVIEALGHIGDQETIQQLKPLLTASDPTLVNAANLAIQRIERREKSGPKTRPRRVGKPGKKV
jgi:HEAT repeat protein